MKGCAKIREQLSAFIDGKLSAEEATLVEGHIAECPQCSAALADLRKVVAHLQGLEQVEPPAWFTQKVMARVRSTKRASEGKGLFNWFFRPFYITAPIGALATALLAVTTYFIFQGVIGDMPTERAVRDSEILQQIAVPEKMPEQKSAPQKPQRATEDAAKGETVTKYMKANEPAMKSEMSAQKPRGDAGTGSADGYAPAPKAKYHVAGPAYAPAPAPEMKAGVAAPPVAPATSAREPEYQASGNVTKAKRAMAPGVSRSQSYDKAAVMRDEDTYATSKKYRPMMVEKAPVSFHIAADDTAAAGRVVVAAANEYHGSNIRTDVVGDKTIVRAELNVSWLPMFFERIKKAGVVQEKMAPMFADVSSVQITVEISQSK